MEYFCFIDCSFIFCRHNGSISFLSPVSRSGGISVTLFLAIKSGREALGIESRFLRASESTRRKLDGFITWKIYPILYLNKAIKLCSLNLNKPAIKNKSYFSIGLCFD